MLSSTEAEASAGVGKPEDSLSPTSRSGLSATGKPATNKTDSDLFCMFLHVMILMRNVFCFQVGLQLLRPGSEEILLGAC